MDMRETVKWVWLKIYEELGDQDWHNLRDSIVNRAVDSGHLTSTAKEKRLTIAIETVREKIWDKTEGLNDKYFR